MIHRPAPWYSISAIPRQDTPFDSGKYSVAPGLSKLNGNRVIEIDVDTPRYIAEKTRLLSTQPHEHVCYDRFTPDIRAAVTQLLHDRVHHDCAGWIDHLDPLQPRTFEALCAAIPDDIAVIRRKHDQSWTCALHVCFPNGWAPKEKIGLDFAATHAPVPGMNLSPHHSRAMTDLMISARDGLERFVWGLRTDERLDHRPEVPSRPWSPQHPGLWVRVERQVILGIPDVEAAVFFIRTYLTHVQDLTQRHRWDLAKAVESMSPESAAYKGIAGQQAAIADYLRRLPRR